MELKRLKVIVGDSIGIKVGESGINQEREIISFLSLILFSL